ncbi:EAL domain-containing protein [Evansella cellulosilytica]|uniref:Diguanylate phosphodiesterase n=1 Tax=Evansella cellulosilytica (strain ATCC 21833 / DSM 2522 / FERM P-1141 / JCM 9156 / N-4) TaxID=649639 RepID=E6TZ38_EVAC2|nr:EAL domain-containing protein [Evansella cellulosilytica]ADU32481.1 diguanylate phosphodiesterase [Evansella cellulosilytica DSM 2522]
MTCKSCLIDEVIYEIKIDGDENVSFIGEVVEHFRRNNFKVSFASNIIKLEETGVIDLFDFIMDHMPAHHVSFRTNGGEWRPFLEIKEAYKLRWIDDVIENERLTCYFQPIVNQEEEIFGYEILARFQKEDGSLIYPGEIFDAARKRGRLYALDKLCRMTAVKFAARIQDKKAFINFLPTSIYSPEFCLRSTVKLASELNLDPHQLVFEVVETEKVDDIAHLKTILSYYKEKGFEYALDDVGEGYNTYTMLEDISPQYMKLDMQYVQGVFEDEKKQQVAKKFLQKAKEIGATPLAEGVEETNDYQWLKKIGYELFQGYLFGKPSPHL